MFCALLRIIYFSYFCCHKDCYILLFVVVVIDTAERDLLLQGHTLRYRTGLYAHITKLILIVMM